MRQTLAVSLALSVFVAAGAISCSGPHTGKSEKLKKPREKKRPDDVEKAGGEPVADTKCRTNFFANPTKKRRPSDAARLARAADPILADAESADGEAKVGYLVSAIEKLSNALKKDPYGPLPTFKLAVAYALAGRQGCAVALLERLNALQKHPDVEREASRTVKRALKDPAFEGFRQEATTALGE